MKQNKWHFILYFLLAGIIIALLIPKQKSAFAQSVDFIRAEEDGYPSIEVISSNENEIILDVTIAGLSITDIDANDLTFQRLFLPQSGYTIELGKPELPTFGHFLAIPQGATVDIEILDASSETINNILVYPVQKPQVDCVSMQGNLQGAEENFEFDEDFYNQDIFFPTNSVVTDEISSIRGVPVTVVRFTPFQYNPSERELTVYSHLRVRLSFGGVKANFVDNRVRGDSFESLYQGMLLNYEQLGEPEENSLSGAGGGGGAYGAQFLIITHPNFTNAAYTLANYRNLLGISTYVRTTTDTGTTSSAIKSYIQTAYDTWDIAPEFVLLLGDAEFIPTNYQTAHPNSSQGMIGTDLYYATVDGSDHYPDIHMGRISVDTATEANNRINAIINYPASGNHYNDISVAAYFQDQDTYDPVDGYAARRFAQTSEEIRTYLVSQGYSVERIYYTESNINPTNWNKTWISNGEPIPAELLRSNGFAWDGSSTDITNAINAGRLIVNHRDHGWTGGWGDPYFSTNYVQNLTNGNKLPIVFSMNCQTGWFDNETDSSVTGTSSSALHFSEAWERNPNGGAVGIIAAARNSYSGYNDYMALGFYDAIWPNFLSYNNTDFSRPEYRMGAILDYGKYAMSALWGDWNIEWELFHYFGDPTMMIAVGTLPATPSNFRQTGVVLGDRISLAWNDVSNEIGYKIYRWYWDGSEWHLLLHASTGANVTSYTDWDVSCGETHYYEVSAYNARGESSREPYITTNTYQCPPHDDFNNAIDINDVRPTHEIPTHGATQNTDDPTPSCLSNAGRATVWYKYTPTSNSAISFDTKTSDYDTFIAVWTGTRTNLHSIACNDDIDWSNGITQSQVAFRVQANVTYYIEVGEWWDGWSATSATSLKDKELIYENETPPLVSPPAQ